MKLTFTLLTLFSFSILKAQFSTTNSPFSSPMINNTIVQSNTTRGGSPIVKGSEFANDEYQHGELWAKQNLHFAQSLLYKFNEFQNQVEIKDTEGNEIAIKTENIDSFHLKTRDKTIVHYYKGSFLNSRSLRNSFVQLIYTGKNISIYKVPHKVFREKPFNGYTSDAKYQFEYLRQDEYYIKNGTHALEPLKLTKKDLLHKIPSKKAALSSEFEYIDFFDEITENKLIELLKKIKA